MLAQRILKHLHELVVSVADPRVPADNNLAERSLPPASSVDPHGPPLPDPLRLLGDDEAVRATFAVSWHVLFL